MQRKTASKVGLMGECRFPFSPHAEWPAVDSGPAADRGSRFHFAIAEYIEGRPLLAIDEDIRAEYTHAVAWIDALRAKHPEAIIRAEVIFAWDPATDAAETFEGRGPREYDDDGRVWGSADLVVAFDRDIAQSVTIYDWATGDGTRKGPQLRTLALMAARVYGVEHASVAALEAKPDGIREVAVEDDLDSLTLASIAGELADLVSAIPGAKPRPGEHCSSMWCPARTTCPEMHAAHAELVPAEALVRRFSTEIQDADHAVWMLDRITLVTSACEQIKDAIKARIPEDGWPLADGGKLIEATRKMPRFDKFKALALLKQLGATPEQIEALTYKFTEGAGLRVVGGPKAAKPKRSRTKAA